MPYPHVQLAQGTIVGRVLTNSLPCPVEAFRGIPYALPPTGDRRFRPAQKVFQDPSAVLDAAEYGPSAPGKPLAAVNGGVKMKYSEDCLTTNIFRHPTSSLGAQVASNLLPVAIYIHGGAFNRGTASMHDTASMVAHASIRPYIAVSFNYRLGALGFLPSTASAREGILNLGLKDQIRLFEWVRDNIKEFGGDPKNITLIGLSAGAHSGENPLFHRVILESGAPTSRAVRPYDAKIHELQFYDFLKEIGCPPDNENVLAFLRDVPYQTICDAQTAVFDKYNPSLQWAWQPVIDGDIIQRPPLETWRSGKWHRMPIMTGFTRNEGSLYVPRQLDEAADFTSFFATLIPLLDDPELAGLNLLYPDPLDNSDSPYKETRTGVGKQYKRLEAAYANYAYQAPCRQTAEFGAAASMPVYVYQWALESSVTDGARHGDNMRYEACTPAVMKVSESQAQIARAMNSYVSSFVATGDPSSGLDGNLPKWEAYTNAKPRAMVFGLNNKELLGGTPGNNPATEMMDDTWAGESLSGGGAKSRNLSSRMGRRFGGRGLLEHFLRYL